MSSAADKLLAHAPRKIALLALAVIMATAVCGCQAPPKPTAPTATTLHLADYDAYLNETMSVLRRYDLDPQYVDRTRGTIVTEPTTSAQWFEFWRVDAPGSYQSVEANLHTIQRSVEVEVTPAEASESEATAMAGPGAYRVRVTANKYRYSAPERQVTTASGALNLYSTRIPTTAGVRGPQTARPDWVPLGRDTLLEEFLLRQLSGVADEITTVTAAD